ncbi:Cloroperoxidase [Sistotremastrum suecicum HHB10207 ss-3]|uniref:Cloroperoxidase n=1 Tax=Sistotremastrum suecicum HHB10207 ss-3 TaxID=1314776 RepID=A0A165ZVN7_9AGAM|nr:Cloroperoxidase [Sistotremastrum suecicum HHB10207 ss-3]
MDSSRPQLSNHGYLPRDGRDISCSQLYHALREVYNLSIPLTIVLVYGTFLILGKLSLSSPHLRFSDLHKLSQHNKVEHDASLVHANASPKDAKWAPTQVDPELLDQLMEHAEDAAKDHDGLTPTDFGKIRALRNRVALVNGPLSYPHRLLAWGESAFLIAVLGGPEERIRPEVLRAFVGEEKLPVEEGWVRPSKKVGLDTVNDIRKRVQNAQSDWEKAHLDSSPEA